MNSILIGLNSEFSNETTYDVFVSTCDPVSWQIVANDISYDDFPVSVGLDTYGITGSCYNYYVSGDTGCEFTGTGTSYNYCPTPTPSPTPTMSMTQTQTPTPTQTQTQTPTPTVTQTVTPSATPSVTPSSSNACRYYTLLCPGTPNSTNAVFSYTRCDGSLVTGLVVTPATSLYLCIRIGTLSLVSGPAGHNINTLSVQGPICTG